MRLSLRFILPLLLVLGAVHGNETCGALAIEQLLQDIDSGRVAIERGSGTFVPVTNPLAWQLGQRTGDRNLNRNLAPSAIPQDFEDRIANVLCPLLDAHDVLLDLQRTVAAEVVVAEVAVRKPGVRRDAAGQTALVERHPHACSAQRCSGARSRNRQLHWWRAAVGGVIG